MRRAVSVFVMAIGLSWAVVASAQVGAVKGETDATVGVIGVLGTHNATTGSLPGVQGSTASTDADASGVKGVSSSPTPGFFTAGVLGLNFGTTDRGVGVYGQHTGNGTGVQGTSNGLSGLGVFGFGQRGGVRGDSINGNGLHGQVSGGLGVGVLGVNFGLGSAGTFQISNAANNSTALMGETNGTGIGVLGTHSATTGTNPGVRGETNSTAGNAVGVTGIVTSTTPGGFSAGVRGINNGTGVNGIGVHGSQAGSGWGVQGESSSGIGVLGTSGAAGSFGASSQIGVLGISGTIGLFGGPLTPGGVGVWGSSSDGTGVAAVVGGAGTGLYVDHVGSIELGGDIAVFQGNGFNRARIDKTGKGFFNGGTQTGGADLAEAFEVEGDREAYEPGDVLAISTRSDRTLEKSSEANSTLVAGVYATKPGVLLTDLDIEADASHRVPLGVVGVIPTKVSAEHGAIRRGDLLVTAAIPGHAMKAGATPAMGTVLGKALQDFAGPGTGVINVLVNVK